MDPVRRLQLVRALIQLDDQQNIVALQHQHQVIHQRRLRRQRRWWCRPWLLRRPAFGQFENLMMELRIEDPASFQNFVWCEPAIFQEMVDRLNLQAPQELPQGAGPRTEGGHHSSLHGYRGQFQKFAIWFQRGIQHNLCADSWGQFWHSGRLPRRGHHNSYHSWPLDGHRQHQQPQMAVPSLPWGNR